MRPDAFVSRERGIVRKTQSGFWAFLPAEAPRRVSLSDEVVKLLDEATGAVHRLGGVGRFRDHIDFAIGAEDKAYALAHHWMIVDQHHFDHAVFPA